jgi:alpha-1,2-mannosyltransferase
MSAVERTAVLPEPREQRLPGAGMFAAGRRLVVGALFASLPALLVLIAAYPLQSKVYGWDLRAFYDAGHAFVQHRSPYPEASLSALASQNNFVYPLPVAAIFAPLSVLPFPLVFALFVALNTVCIILTLRILGVRDRLCYAAALLALPAQYAIKLGTISPLLALGLALLWRYRDRRLVAAMTIAGLIVAKLFLWPLAIWLIATRRIKTTVAGAGVAAAAVLLALLPSGYGVSTYRDYPHLLRMLSAFESGWNFSLVGFGRAAGLSLSAATALAIVVGGALLVGVLVLGRRGREFASFRLAIAAAFALSPIVWPHYFVLLLVPLAIAQPRFSLLWLVLAWLPPQTVYYDSHRALWILGALVAAGLQLSAGSWEGVRGRLGALRRPMISGLAVAALAAALEVSAAAINSATNAVAGLAPPAGTMAGASGTAFLRIDERRREVCEQVWTEKIPAGRVTTALSRRSVVFAAQQLMLDGDGVGRGCVTLDGSAPTRGLMRAIGRTPGLFRMRLTAATGSASTLRGALEKPVDAGRTH